jgi:hypothetical protein
MAGVVALVTVAALVLLPASPVSAATYTAPTCTGGTGVSPQNTTIVVTATAPSTVEVGQDIVLTDLTVVWSGFTAIQQNNTPVQAGVLTWQGGTTTALGDSTFIGTPTPRSVTWTLPGPITLPPATEAGTYELIGTNIAALFPTYSTFPPTPPPGPTVSCAFGTPLEVVASITVTAPVTTTTTTTVPDTTTTTVPDNPTTTTTVPGTTTTVVGNTTTTTRSSTTTTSSGSGGVTTPRFTG